MNMYAVIKSAYCLLVGSTLMQHLALVIAYPIRLLPISRRTDFLGSSWVGAVIDYVWQPRLQASRLLLPKSYKDIQRCTSWVCRRFVVPRAVAE